ncbi:hypothetical protein Lser_V15G29223 [Lactuca serriola]
MHPFVFIILSLPLLHLETTTASHLVAVVVNDNGVTNKCLDKERHALLLFKAGLQDPDGHLSSWTAEEDDCCSWFGVMCNNQTGHVTGLDISNHGLVGEISYSLLNLIYLNHLNLSYNSFHGAIPTFIGSMTRLKYLNLGQNGFHGTVPGSIGSLTKLEHLCLFNNSLYGTIPPEFGNLTNLKVLDLNSVGRCRFENLEWLSSLSHLERLEMDGISLAKQNHWVDVILSLRKLSYLSLGGCELSQVMHPYSYSFLNSSSSIHTLDLVYNKLTSSMYPWLFPLTSNNLLHLYLSYNMLDGIPKYLGKLCSLTSLYLYNNSAVVQFPDFLKNLSGCTSLTLQELDVSHSQFRGILSDEIQKFSSLKILNLSENQLNGSISEKLWELPMLEKLDVSSNYLRGVISENIGRSKLSVIDLSKNSLQVVPSTYHMSNLSYIESIDLSSCKLGPHFPKWIQTLKNPTHLDISDTGISRTIPVKFWDMWPSRLRYLNLSSNNLSGKVPDLLSNFDDNSVIDLSFNNFYGSIPNISSTLVSLDLSRNKFYGGITFLCQIVGGLLQFLDLSHNLLTGKLPDCLWHFKQLNFLILGHNNLSGMLPPSIGFLIELKVLYLYKNNFSGELPLSFLNCTNLISLNLGANKFSGNVSAWIGENLPGLYVLILRSNNFFGTIPLELCQLENLQILDLSANNLHGTIPSCLSNLTNMVQAGFSQEQYVHHYYSYGIDAAYVDHAVKQWLEDEHEFLTIPRLLKSIDLSGNRLSGQIPSQLTNLYELIALNLSKNALVGEIPREIGQMGNLLVLDLSRNSFSGHIPSSMSQMTSLSYLDMSCNNLSGRIPSAGQLQLFDPSKYSANLGLCGPPLTKICPGDEELEVPTLIGESDIDEHWEWFYIGGVFGFPIGFWIACGALLLNRRGRHAFFQFYDSFKDWVYVKFQMIFETLESETRRFPITLRMTKKSTGGPYGQFERYQVEVS